MTKQILPNGLYHIKSSIDETLTLTLKKLENEEETTLQFEPINEKNDNQLFYLKYQQNENAYSIITYQHTNVIGVKYSTSETGSFVIENNLSFSPNSLWNIIPIKNNENNDNNQLEQKETSTKFELQVKSSQQLIRPNLQKLHHLEKEFNSNEIMISYYQMKLSICQSFDFQITQTSENSQFKIMNKNIEFVPEQIQQEIAELIQEINQRKVTSCTLQQQIDVLNQKINDVKIGIECHRDGLQEKQMMLKDTEREKECICQFYFEKIDIVNENDNFTRKNNKNKLNQIKHWIHMIQHIEECAFLEEYEFLSSTKQLLQKPMEVFKKLTKVTLPSSLQQVEEKTFDHLLIKEVHCLPYQLKFFGERKDEIKNIIFTEESTDIDENLFDSFSYINTLYIPLSITSIKSNILDGKIIDTLTCDPRWLGQMGDFKVKHYNIPNGITSIQTKQFENIQKTFEKVTLPSSLQNVSKDVFKSFTSITEIQTSSQFVQSFKRKQLKKIIIRNNNNDAESNEIDLTIFEKCKNLRELHIPMELCQPVGNCLSLKRLKKLACSTKLLSKIEISEIEELQFFDQMQILDRSLIHTCVCLQSLILPPKIGTVDHKFCESLTQLTRVKCNLKILSELSCSTLQTVELLETETEIDSGVFELYPNLKELHIPTTITHIGNFEFDNNRFETVECDPKWLYLFTNKNNSLKKLIIPEGIVSLHKKQFEECRNLTYIEIPKSVTFIEEASFDSLYNLREQKCESKWVDKFLINIYTIPESEKEITRRMFYNCRTIKQINIDADIDIVRESTFENCECLQEINFKTSNKRLKEIRANAFKNCESLTSITFPSTITQLKIHPTAFDGCSNIKTLNCSNQIKRQIQIICTKELSVSHDVVLISRDKYKEYINIETLEIPLKTKIEFPEYFFNQFPLLHCLSCNSEYLRYLSHPERIDYFIIPEKLETLQSGMLPKLKSIEMIQIPLHVKYIEQGAFDGLDNLEYVKCRFNQLKYFDKKKLKTIVIQETFFQEKYMEIFKDCSELETVILPDDCLQLKKKLFKNCHKLKTIQYHSGNEEQIRSSLSIPENTKQIERDEYKYIDNIDKLIIPLSVERVHSEAFKHMQLIEKYYGDPKWLEYIPSENIKEIHIPKEIESIDDFYFKNCINLQYLSIGHASPKLSIKYFHQLLHLRKIKCSLSLIQQIKYHLQKYIQHIKLMNGDETLPTYFFESFVQLECVELPRTMKRIEQNAFCNCPQLNSIIIPNTIEECHHQIFIYCPSLSSVTCPVWFINSIPGNQILSLTLTTTSNEKISLQLDDFKGFDSLECLKLPKNVIQLPNDLLNKNYCPNIIQLKCCEELYQSMDDEMKNKLKTIQYKQNREKKTIINNLYGIEGRKMKYEERITILNDNKTIDRSNCDLLKVFDDINSLLIDNQNEEENQIKDTDENKQYYEIAIDIIDQLEQEDVLIKKDWYNYWEDFRNYKKCPLYVLQKNLDDENTTNNENETIELKQIVEDLLLICKGIKNIDIIETLDKPEKQLWKPLKSQLITVLRMANELLNPHHSQQKDKEKQTIQISKGCIAELKPGEGKSGVFLLLSLLLGGCYGRSVDVVFPDIDIAIQTFNNHKRYYDFFNVKVDVLQHKDKKKEMLNSSKPNEENKISQSITEITKKNVYEDVLKCPIIYSTCENLETIYLKSLFTNTPIRLPSKLSHQQEIDSDSNMDTNNMRPYDIILLDEIDIMFNQKHNKMSLIAKDHDYLYSSDLFEIVYLTRNQSVEDIRLIVDYYLKDGVTVTNEIIQKLKEAALEADTYQLNIDYIIEEKDVKKIEPNPKEENVYKTIKQKIIIPIDKNTGKGKVNQRFENYLHEMIEVKEQVDITINKNYIKIIPHKNYLNFYKCISGVTTAIGTSKDEQMLQDNYQVDLFRVPRNKCSNLIVYERERPTKKNLLYEMIEEEIRSENLLMKRPTIVVVDTVDQVDELTKLYPYSQQIKIIDSTTSEMISKITQSEMVTFIPALLFKRIKLPPSKKPIHMIIPYWLQSQRMLESVVSHFARYGNSTVSIYTNIEDYINKQGNQRIIQEKENQQIYDNIITLQETFSNDLLQKFPWIFKSKSKEVIIQQYPFGLSWKETIQILKVLLSKRKMKILDKKEYNNFVFELIMISWGVFLTNIYDHSEKYTDINYCLQEYVLFLNSFDDITKYNKEQFMDAVKQTLLSEEVVYFLSVQVVGGIIKCFVPGIPGQLIKTSIGLVIRNGYEIARQRKSGKKIDYRKLFFMNIKEIALHSISVFDIGGLISAKVMNDCAHVMKALLQNKAVSKTIQSAVKSISSKAIKYGSKTGIKTTIKKFFGGIDFIQKRIQPNQLKLIDIAKNEINQSQSDSNQFKKYMSLSIDSLTTPYEKQRKILSSFCILNEIIRPTKSDEQLEKEENKRKEYNQQISKALIINNSVK